MAQQSFRSFSAWTCATYLFAGVTFLALGVFTRVVPASTSMLSWISILLGVTLVLYALFSLGLALGRRDSPKCPHCSQEINVTVDMWSGRIGAKKPDSST